MCPCLLYEGLVVCCQTAKVVYDLHSCRAWIVYILSNIYSSSLLLIVLCNVSVHMDPSCKAVDFSAAGMGRAGLSIPGPALSRQQEGRILLASADSHSTGSGTHTACSLPPSTAQ